AKAARLLEYFDQWLGTDALPTTFVRDAARFGHFTHASARSRSAAKAAAFSGEDGEWMIEAGSGAAGGADGI
ncbi:MAG: hypothetical protein RL616_1741, partial [Verrucomicrobiota bacterium]